MSNCDHSIDQAVAEELRNKPDRYAQYSGGDFCGYVWRAGERWACEVWQYKSPVQVIMADTLEGLMAAVSAEYGAD